MNSSKLAAIRALAGRHGGRVLSFVDQGLLGLAAFGVNIMLARHFSEIAFATVTVMMGLHFLIFGLHRAMVVLPYILDDGASPSGPSPERQRAWWTVNLVFIGCAAALLAVAPPALRASGVVGPQMSWAIDSAFLLAFTAPPLLAFEYGRRVLYQTGRVVTVAVGSAVYLLTGVATAAVGVLAGSAEVGGFAFATAGLAGFAVFLAATRPGAVSLPKALSVWRPQARFGAWQAMTSIPYNIYAISPVVLVGAFAGPAAAAVFGAARTIASPAFSIVSAVDSMDKPRAARAMAQTGFKGLHASIKQTRILILVLAGGFLGLVMLFTPWAMAAAFGEKYADQVATVRIVAVSFLFLCLNQPVETMLIVLRKVRVMFVIRLAAAVAIALGIWWGARVAGVLGVAIAAAIVQTGVLLTLAAIEFRLSRNDEATRPERRPD